MKQLDLFVLSVLTVIVAACGSSPAGAPSAPASPAIVCDTAQFQPPPPLTCGPAITQALAVRPPVIRRSLLRSSAGAAYARRAHRAFPRCQMPRS